MHHHHDQRLEDGIRECAECRDVCQDTLYNHCLEMGGEHAGAEHVRLMVDCIEACQVAADSMRRGSRIHPVLCAACAEVCDACAASCEEIGGEEMDRCAEACRACARSCREMGKMKEAA